MDAVIALEVRPEGGGIIRDKYDDLAVRLVERWPDLPPALVAACLREAAEEARREERARAVAVARGCASDYSGGHVDAA